MLYNQKIWFAADGERKISILPRMASRHGLIAGATGTGKTVTLKVLAESFSDCGVPVFLADAKGDLAGMCRPGADSEDMRERVERFGLSGAGFSFREYPVCFWDIFGEKGIPLRTTVSEMGPTLLAHLMDLNPTQSDILRIVFKIADDDGLLLIDTKDLRSMLQYVGEHAKEFSMEYGNMQKQSLASIVRAVVALEDEGGGKFFGEPALDIKDWFKTDPSGRGVINILDCQSLINSPSMYAAFMLWMVSELFEIMPEAGDTDRPRMVFFFDEAHLLFDNAPKALLEKLEQVVKLIRSKGIGIYFITQSPADIPDDVLAQLGNKIQHALHAYTPVEQKRAKAAADSFRANPAFDTLDAVLNLGIAEAVVSVLDEEGRPGMVERCKILPPQSFMGAISDDERKKAVEGNLLCISYKDPVDRDSAYELLQRKTREETEESRKAEEEELRAKEEEKRRVQEEKAEERRQAQEAKAEERRQAQEAKEEERRRAQEEKAEEKRRAQAEKEAERMKRQQMSAIGKVAKTATSTIGREFGNEIGKRVGGSFGKRLGGNMGAALGRGILDTLFKL